MFCFTVSQGNTPYSWKMTPRSGPGRSTGLPSNSTWPVGRLLEAGQHAHHRGLAAAGRTDHGDEVAVIDVVGDVLDDVERALRRTERQRHVIELRALRGLCAAAHAIARSCHTSRRALILRRIRSMISAMQPMQMMPT